MKLRFARDPTKDYQVRVVDAIWWVETHPEWGYARIKRELVKKHSKGLRKETFLALKRDVLNLPKKTSPTPQKLTKAAISPPKVTVYSKHAVDLTEISNWKWIAAGTSKIHGYGFRIFERTYGFTLIDDSLVSYSTKDLRFFLKWLVKRFPESIFNLKFTVVIGSRDINTSAKAIQQYDQKTDRVRVYWVVNKRVGLYEDSVMEYHEKISALANRDYPCWLVAIEVTNYAV